MSRTPAGCSCFVVVWLLGWTAGTLTFDAFIGWALYHQTRALAFATTEGTVTRSAVRTEPDGDGGDSYLPDVGYEYEVGGRRYTGSRYCYAEVGTNSKAWHKVAAARPPGARVTVWYNPADPGEAILHPGPTGTHLALLWFLTPFNVVMFGGWVAFARSRRPAFDPADRRSVEPTPTGWRVHLPTLGRAARFGGCLLAVTFVGTFALGFGFGFDPPVWLAGGAYLAAVAVAARLALGYTPPVLEVNRRKCVLWVIGGPEPVKVPFAAVRAVRVTRFDRTISDGTVTSVYLCELHRTNGEPVIEVETFHEPETAGRFAAWLRAQIGLNEPDA